VTSRGQSPCGMMTPVSAVEDLLDKLYFSATSEADKGAKQRYKLGSRSAIDSLIDRYQVRTDGHHQRPERLGPRGWQPPLHPRPHR
jgi:hypothetical protein